VSDSSGRVGLRQRKCRAACVECYFEESQRVSDSARTTWPSLMLAVGMVCPDSNTCAVVGATRVATAGIETRRRKPATWLLLIVRYEKYHNAMLLDRVPRAGLSRGLDLTPRSAWLRGNRLLKR